MKPSFLSIIHLALLLAVLLITHLAFGQTSGTWTNATSNSAWTTGTNWSGGIIADGADAVADFGTLDITSARTVNLGANRTIGTLIFGDATTASHNWALANGTGGPWTLTLATSAGAPLIQVNNQTTTISALLGGTQGFTKTGTGTLTLSNTANSLTGGISLNAGVLNFASGSLGTNLVTITANATLGWSAGNTQDIFSQLKIDDGVTATLATGTNNVTFGSPIQTGVSASASVTKIGTGILTFTAVNTYTGTTRVNGGRMVLSGGDNRLNPSSTITLGQGAGSGVLQLGDSAGVSHQTITGIATAGTGTANAIIGGNAALSTLTINNTTAVSYAGIIGGIGTNENNLSISKASSGALTLSNASNTFTGNIDINGGSVIITKAALGVGPKTVTVSGTTNAPTLRLDGSSGNISLGSDISLITSNDNATNPALLNTAGDNTISGPLSLTTGGFGGGNTRIKINGGNLSLTGSISPHITAASAVTLILDPSAGTSGSISSVVSDNLVQLGITKAGAGLWSLSGANSYTGATTINAGTLQISSIANNGTAQPLGTATSPLLIGSTSAGTLEYTGTQAATLGRSISVNGNGGAIIANSSGATLTLSGTQARGNRSITYSGGSFVISGRITGTSTASPLTIDSSTVRITHNNNSYVSPTLVQNGSTLIVANTLATSSATGTGDVTIDATSTLAGTGFINAGTDNSISVSGNLVVGDPGATTAADLDITTSGTGKLTLGTGSVLYLDIVSGAGLGDSSLNAAAADRLRLFGSIDISSGATLKLTNPNHLTNWAHGDIFKLIDWAGLATRSGSFTLDDSDLDLPSGYSLDTSSLYTLGTIAITVPEPSRAVLTMAGILALVLRRRRW